MVVMVQEMWCAFRFNDELNLKLVKYLMYNQLPFIITIGLLHEEECEERAAKRTAYCTKRSVKREWQSEAFSLPIITTNASLLQLQTSNYPPLNHVVYQVQLVSSSNN